MPTLHCPIPWKDHPYHMVSEPQPHFTHYALVARLHLNQMHTRCRNPHNFRLRWPLTMPSPSSQNRSARRLPSRLRESQAQPTGQLLELREAAAAKARAREQQSAARAQQATSRDEEPWWSTHYDPGSWSWSMWTPHSSDWQWQRDQSTAPEPAPTSAPEGPNIAQDTEQEMGPALGSQDPHVQAARRILAAMEPGEAQTVLKFLSALPHPSSVLTPGPQSTNCVDQATQTETVRQSTAQVQTEGSESQPEVRSSPLEGLSTEEPIGLPLCSLHSAQATDMPIDAGELIEWSATSLILLPTIKNRLNTMLLELFRMLASLQELKAGDHIIAAREAQHYTALHSEFHQAPELAVGNWVLAMAGELIAPGLNQHFRADDTFGSFVEAWLVQLRRARDSPGTRTSEMQRRFIRLASLLHDVVAPMQQSRQLYDLMSWRRGKAYNLRILLTVANWSPPELASPLLPERRVCSLEDEARQDPGTDSPGGTADAGSSLAGTTMMADIAQGTQDGVVVSTPSGELVQEPVTIRLFSSFSRTV